jgi:hypothetical protein
MHKLTLSLSTALIVLGSAAPALADDNDVPILGGGLTVPIDYYWNCFSEGGDTFSSDDLEICRNSDGWEVWCDATPDEFGTCTLFPPGERPGPAGQASTGAPSTGTAAPAAGGAAGPAAVSGGMIQLEIQR